MDEEMYTNLVTLRGDAADKPRLSHTSRGERFFQFALDVPRLSGAVDTLQVIARESLLDELELGSGQRLFVEGELRTFNNRSGTGPKLVITVFAKQLRFEDGPDENRIFLRGTLCKTPTYRVTPMGREITDMMLAVNRRCGRSDYIPCIAWGKTAREASALNVGAELSLQGRVQSRVYTKTIDGESFDKVAYEVSVICLSPED